MLWDGFKREEAMWVREEEVTAAALRYDIELVLKQVKHCHCFVYVSLHRTLFCVCVFIKDIHSSYNSIW